jgi:hypothetical protein
LLRPPTLRFTRREHKQEGGEAGLILTRTKHRARGGGRRTGSSDPYFIQRHRGGEDVGGLVLRPYLIQERAQSEGEVRRTGSSNPYLTQESLGREVGEVRRTGGQLSPHTERGTEREVVR